jgi:peptidyl-tRNA hydrolase
MLYSISCYYDDIQAALGLAGLAVFEMIMIAQEVSTAKHPTYVENGKITKMGVGPNQLLKRDEIRNKLF